MTVSERTQIESLNPSQMTEATETPETPETMGMPIIYPRYPYCVECRYVNNLTTVETQLKKIIELLSGQTNRRKIYDELYVSTTTTYTPYKIALFLNQNAETIIVSNDGPGLIYLIYTNDGTHYSKEFTLPEGKASKFYNVNTIQIRAALVGANYRVTEYNITMQGDNDYYSEKRVFSDKSITDTSTYNSTTFDAKRFKVITLYIANTLDQIVTIQVKANRSDSTTGSVNVGSSFTVAATTGIEARTIEVSNDGWLPYYYITATASGTPTSGSLNCYISGRN